MTTSEIEHNRAKAMWRRCLSSAFRTTLACLIVAGVTLHGPGFLTRYIAFPAFSYVTVILVVTDATLGDTLRCCWLSLYATVQGVCPAILSLWLIGPARLSSGTTAVVVGISAFMVALPANTHLISKRIALGQIVLVYVVGFINGAKTDPIMHPIQVAASTAVGVVACVLALSLPYPSLALSEVKENCRLYIDNASERLKLYVKAFSAEDDALQKGLITRTKFLNLTAGKLLPNIESKQDAAQWERFLAMFFKSYYRNPAEKLRNLETVLRGMEISLKDCSKFPVKIKGYEIKNDLAGMEELLLNQVKNMEVEKTILPQSDEETDSMFLQTLQSSTAPRLASKDLPSLFFMFCLRLIQIKPEHGVTAPGVSCNQESESSSQEYGPQKTTKHGFMTRIWCACPHVKVDRRRLLSALRCSLSLGLAVLFGSMYSKENGFWSGLPVAISHAAAREATFKVANIKAQGTVLGSVYGVMGCFVFENYVKIRFISLLPWFIFCSFLRCSKMYAQAGGISAVIGAVIILGRDNFGSPSDFAITRIVETFIGLSCSIGVDMVFHPTRAAVLAKRQLSKSLKALHESVGSITLDPRSTKCSSEASQKKLKKQVNELGKLIEEAEVEPNFWFLPFHSACYSKLRGSLMKMVDLLNFGSQALGFLKQESTKPGGCGISKDQDLAVINLEDDLKALRDGICSWIQLLEEVSLLKSPGMLEKVFEKEPSSVDLEVGKSSAGVLDDDAMEKTTNSFLDHLNELVDGMGSNSGSGSGSGFGSSSGSSSSGLKSQVIISLGALMFCMNGVVRETKEIQKAVKEAVEWENPTFSQLELHHILCKILMP